MTHPLTKLSLAIILALALGGLGTGLALADEPVPPAVPPTPEPLDCRECHESFYTAWSTGQHGSGANDSFLATWETQGKPQACLSCHTTEGLSCESCHSPISAEHPLASATVKRQADQCGQCHTATYVGWEVSQHGQNGLTCVDCHDAHATGQAMKIDASTLCANCHKNTESNFAHQAHVPVGLTCVECHVTKSGEPADPHSMRDHGFEVKVETCDACHTSQTLMAGALEGAVPPTPTPVDTMASGLTVTVSETPQPSNPLPFLFVAIVAGFGSGLLAAPWLRRTGQRPGNDNRSTKPWSK